MMMTNKVVFWRSGIDDVIVGKGLVGGIAVQMYFWAKTFIANGWKVYSFTSGESKHLEGVNFVFQKHFRHIDIFFEPIFTIVQLIKIRPLLIVFRGSDRSLLWVSMFSKLIGTKCVMFGASDVNFMPGKDWTAGFKLNTYMYRFGLRFVSHFIVQNVIQQHCLLNHYGKHSLVIPNIWIKHPTLCSNEKKYDVLWVANFRKLKRPEWYINLAQKFPQYRFAMLGGPMKNDIAYYHSIETIAKKTPNLKFFGSVTFEGTNKVFSEARLFVCTSEYEGFPNTFLQAWANNIPVVSTVNPSGLLDGRTLGCEVKSQEELCDFVGILLSDTALYEKMQNSIYSYFERCHSSVFAYKKLINYIKK